MDELFSNKMTHSTQISRGKTELVIFEINCTTKYFKTLQKRIYIQNQHSYYVYLQL